MSGSPFGSSSSPSPFSFTSPSSSSFSSSSSSSPFPFPFGSSSPSVGLSFGSSSFFSSTTATTSTTNPSSAASPSPSSFSISSSSSSSSTSLFSASTTTASAPSSASSTPSFPFGFGSAASASGSAPAPSLFGSFSSAASLASSAAASSGSSIFCAASSGSPLFSTSSPATTPFGGTSTSSAATPFGVSSSTLFGGTSSSTTPFVATSPATTLFGGTSSAATPFWGSSSYSFATKASTASTPAVSSITAPAFESMAPLSGLELLAQRLAARRVGGYGSRAPVAAPSVTVAVPPPPLPAGVDPTRIIDIALLSPADSNVLIKHDMVELLRDAQVRCLRNASVLRFLEGAFESIRGAPELERELNALKGEKKSLELAVTQKDRQLAQITQELELRGVEIAGLQSRVTCLFEDAAEVTNLRAQVVEVNALRVQVDEGVVRENKLKDHISSIETTLITLCTENEFLRQIEPKLNEEIMVLEDEWSKSVDESFMNALTQLRLLNPDLNEEGIGSMKLVREGQIVDTAPATALVDQVTP